MADEMPTENEFGNPAHVESGLRVLAQEYINMKNELGRSLFYPNEKASSIAPESFVAGTMQVMPIDKRLKEDVINADARVLKFSTEQQAASKPWAVLISGAAVSADATKLLPYAGRILVFTTDPRRVALFARKDYAGLRADYMPRTILAYGNGMLEAAQAVASMTKPGDEFGSDTSSTKVDLPSQKPSSLVPFVAFVAMAYVGVAGVRAASAKRRPQKVLPNKRRAKA